MTRQLTSKPSAKDGMDEKKPGLIMNGNRRAWRLAALASLVAGSAALGGACSDRSPGAPSERVATASEALVDQRLIGGNEPTIAVNPTNPVNIAIAAGNSIQVSTDGGQHFTSAAGPNFPGGVGGNGDSSLAFDSAGRLFWAQLGSFDVYVQQVNTTTGQPIGTAVNVSAGAGVPTGQSDKPWIAADRFPGSPYINTLYVGFAGPGGMLFSRSTPADAGASAGASWSVSSSPVSDSGDNTVRSIHVAVGADGAVYIAYHSAPMGAPNNENPSGTTGQIVVKRSDDGGQTFSAANKWPAFGPGQADLSYNFQYLCNSANDAGACTGGTTNVPRKLPRNQNLMLGSSQPWLLADPTSPKILSVVASDDPSNAVGPDYAGVYMVRSVNQGKGATNVTWSTPTRVDGDTVNSLQLMPTASHDISQTQRCLVASYYDNRNYTANNIVNSNGNAFLDVFLRASMDDGTSWGPETLVEDSRIDPDLNAPDVPWAPPPPLPANYVPTRRIGEYNGVAVAHGVAHAVWTGNGSGSQQIFYDNTRMCMDPAMPNPAGNLVAATQSSSVTAVFAIGSDGALYRRWVSNGFWQGPSRIGGANLANPGAPVAVGRLNSNELYVFFVGKDGRVYYAYETNDGTWQTPTSLSAAGFAKSGAYLATGVQSSTQLDLFVVDTNGTLQGFAKQNGSGWSGNIPLASGFAPSGAALATATHPSVDQLDVFAVASNGSVVATFVDGLGPFASPFAISATNVAFGGNPVATGMQGADQLDVFYTGRDGAIHALWFVDTSQPFGPVALSGTSLFPSGALSTIQRGTTLNLFAVNDSGAAVRLWVDGTNAWNGPTALTINGDAFQGAGISAASQGSLTDLFIVGNVYFLEATFNGSSWSNAMPLLP